MRIVLSRLNPDLASVAATVVGGKTPFNAIVLAIRSGGSWTTPGVATTTFPERCGRSVTRALRDLLCPSPWKILGLREPSLPKSAYVVSIRGTWRSIAIPGAVCGSSHPIRLNWEQGFGAADIHSEYWPWWPTVEVDVYGPRNLDGTLGYPGVGQNGEDDAYFHVECTNTGGTGEGILGSADVLFSAAQGINGALGKPLRLLGVVTPQQPQSLASHPASLTQLQIIVCGFTPYDAVLVSSESWFGPYDPSSCCPTGRATTIWRYIHGRLISTQTNVDLLPAFTGKLP